MELAKVDLKGMWPYHPKPQEDELLSSWLKRVATVNGTSVHSFCNIVWPGLQIWTRDIDTLAHPIVLEKLSLGTNTSYKRALETTFLPYSGVLFEEVRINGPTRWINHLGIYHRTRRKPGLQWCPECLRADIDPYYRRRWRLGVASTCLKHGVVLSCRCQACGSPAAPHLSYQDECHKCGLCRSNNKSYPADSRALQFEGLMDSSLRMSVVSIIPGETIHPFILFKTIYHVMQMLASGPRSQMLRRKVSKMYGDVEGFPQFGSANALHGSMSSAHRHAVIAMTARLMTGWPWMFIALCRESEHYWSWITKDYERKEIPYHLYHLADLFLSQEVAAKRGAIR